MTNAQSAQAPASGHDSGRLTAIASLSVGAAFFALWFWLLPQWLGFSVDTAGSARWRWLAGVPSVLGFAVAVRCIWDFGWTGRGTPAPVAPPQRLVVVGFYRYVRNPMYVGFFTGWFGLWTVFGRANSSAFTIALIAVSAVALFVRLYEEPILLTTKPTARMSRAGSPGCAPGTHERLRISRGSRPFAT